MKRICIFCGSSDGARTSYKDAAQRLGVALARRGIGLVYGGGRVGLMGTVADAVLAEGGEVVGVIPHGLVVREAAHVGLTELRVVESMHERKALMATLADAFVSLPPVMATAGFYPSDPPPQPANDSDFRWARFTNITGLVPGLTRLGDELALLYSMSAVGTSVFADRQHWVWNGSQFAKP